MYDKPNVNADGSITVVERIDYGTGFIYGFTMHPEGRDPIVPSSAAWSRNYRHIKWVRLIEPHWVTKTLVDRWRDMGCDELSFDRIEEFEDLCNDELEAGIYYFSAASYDPTESYPNLKEMTLTWILGSMAEIMNERKISSLSQVTSALNLNVFLMALSDKKFNKTKAKDAFRDFIIDNNLERILNDSKYQVADQSIVNSAIETVITNNADQFEKAKTDTKMVNWLVGQVMKIVAGRAAAPEVRDAILARLQS